MHSQYTYYVINTAAGGALIEQAVIVGSDAQPTLSGEVAKLTDDLYRALLTSIDRAPTYLAVNATNPRSTSGDRP